MYLMIRDTLEYTWYAYCYRYIPSVILQYFAIMYRYILLYAVRIQKQNARLPLTYYTYRSAMNGSWKLSVSQPGRLSCSHID